MMTRGQCNKTSEHISEQKTNKEFIKYLGHFIERSQRPFYYTFIFHMTSALQKISACVGMYWLCISALITTKHFSNLNTVFRDIKE